VKKKNGRERQPKASNPDSGRIAVDNEITGTCHYNGSPDATESQPPDAHGREVKLRLGVGGDTELRSHAFDLEGCKEGLKVSVSSWITSESRFPGPGVRGLLAQCNVREIGANKLGSMGLDVVRWSRVRIQIP